jgi:hypothetical protein
MVFWIAAVWFLGGRRILPRRARAEEPLLVWATSLGLAAGTTAMATTLLAAVGWLRPGPLWAVLWAWTALAVLELRRFTWPQTWPQPWATPWTRVLTATLALTAAFTFISVLAPPSSIDALVYHLRVPHEYLRSRRMVPLRDDVRTFQPLNVEMLFAFGMALRDDVVAASLHWVLAIGAALSAGAWARRLRAKSPLVAMAIFVCSPLFVWESTSSFIDLGLSLFTSLGLLWATTEAECSPVGILLAATFAGFAAGSKFTGCGAAVLVGGAAFLHARQERRPGLVRLLTVGAGAALIAAPWYLRNLLWTGNPFFPLANRLFGRGAAQPLSTFVYGYGKDPLHFFSSPFDLIWRGDPFDAGWSMGPAYLALVPLALLSGRRERAYRTLVVVLGAFWLFWFYSSQQMRLLLPILPLCAGLAADGFDRLQSHRWPGRSARAAVALSMAVGLATAAVLAKGSWKVVAGVEPRTAYLGRLAMDYPAFEQVNSRLTDDARVAVCGVPNVYYLRPRATIVSFDEIPALPARGFTHLVWIGKCDDQRPLAGQILWSGRYLRPGSRFQGTGSSTEVCAELIQFR